MKEHINLSEMRAILLALFHFKEDLAHKFVNLASYKSTFVAYLHISRIKEALTVTTYFLYAKISCTSCSVSDSPCHLMHSQVMTMYFAESLHVSRSLAPVSSSEWELLIIFVYSGVVLVWAYLRLLWITDFCGFTFFADISLLEKAVCLHISQSDFFPCFFKRSVESLDGSFLLLQLGQGQ